MQRMLRRALALVASAGLVGSLLAVAPVALAGETQTYLIVYRSAAVPTGAATAIGAANGTLVASYDAIGVAVARSSDPQFAVAIRKDKRVEGATATAGFATQLDAEMEVVETASTTLDGAWGDPLSNRQWDMVNIRVPEAHEVTSGSPAVVVGDIDSGLDYTHPDLAANVDFANSVSCIGGVPNQDPAAWDDDNGHGTHTAGTIAAAANGIGIIGVAPNVKIAGIKAGNADGFLFPEAVICGFMWAADHHLDVTNNSYFVDPWLFNCRNDAEQRAIWKALQRAIRYAQQQGVVVVAAEGNENIDLSKQNVDFISPDTDPDPVPREVTNACVVIPVEIPGVVGVTADGAFEQKSYYSSYGVGTADLTAPGGDRRFQDPGDGSRGFVLSTFPGNRYALAQGTSMASPHVAGVAALIRSQHPNMPPGAVAAVLQNTAMPMACPPNPFDPGGTGTWLATCVGGATNGFYGHGQVDALSAVMK